MDDLETELEEIFDEYINCTIKLDKELPNSCRVLKIDENGKEEIVPILYDLKETNKKFLEFLGKYFEKYK